MTEIILLSMRSGKRFSEKKGNMNVQLGKKIKELRKAKNISQEVLAQYLGVSFQAVSKWENEMAMPDVAMVPAIAYFFGVSTDELFDYNRLEAEQNIEAICHEAYKYRDSNPARSEEILRAGLKQYPGNEIILNNLLYTMKATERSEEMITICKSLIESTHDDEVRFDAIRILASIYHETGQQVLVEPTLEKLPEIYFTKLDQMAILLEGEKAIKAARSQFGLCAEQMITMLVILQKEFVKQGNNEASSKYKRIAKEVLESLETENKDNFYSKEFSEWIEQSRKIISCP